jgi:carboxymethylenebutenolidase
MSDLDAAADWGAKHSHGDISRLGITGFCWGGRAVWLYAAHSSRLKAGAAWYGRLADKPAPLQPKNAIENAPSLKAPVIGFYAGQDQGITMEAVEQMRAVLKANNKTAEIDVYPDAQHGFNADYRPSYNKTDTEDAWKKLLAWFRKYGVS